MQRMSLVGIKFKFILTFGIGFVVRVFIAFVAHTKGAEGYPGRAILPEMCVSETETVNCVCADDVLVYLFL